MSELERRLEFAEVRYEQALQRLAEKARWMGADLVRLADRLDASLADGSKPPVISSLGEVQGRGSEIDVLCGVSEERREQVLMLRQLKEEQ